MKEWQRNWLIFFGWLTLCELIILAIFLFVFMEKNWWLFLLAQIPCHFIAFVFYAFTLAGIDASKEEEKRNEWYKRVNKMLKDYEEKENENEQSNFN